jgi:hypothetical protein
MASLGAPTKDEGNYFMDFLTSAKHMVLDYYNHRVEKTDDTKLELDDVYIVWFSKTLQNWKALVSTTVPDGMYYEVTYNGDFDTTYLDAYKKWDNIAVVGEGKDRKRR